MYRDFMKKYVLYDIGIYNKQIYVYIGIIMKKYNPYDNPRGAFCM